MTILPAQDGAPFSTGPERNPSMLDPNTTVRTGTFEGTGQVLDEIALIVVIQIE